MIHPTPPGTRDVLPDEMRELRELAAVLRRSFERAGFGEVRTPALEYEDVLRRGDQRAGAPAFRLFDSEGNVLALRSDMTVPIARLVATRYADAPLPLRLSYFAHAFRAVERGRGHASEFLQAGVELIGAQGPVGDAEVAALVLRALAEAGLRRHRIGLGDASLYPRVLERFGVPEPDRQALLDHLRARNLVGLEMAVDRLGLHGEAREALVTLPGLRGGVEVLDRVPASATAAVEGLRACHELLAAQGLGDRVILDLGLTLELRYYTGPVFEVYDPAVGFAIGAGGRYDDLLGRFGRPLPACGVALHLERVHVAKAEEERLG